MVLGGNRGEKLSTTKLTVVQYGILAADAGAGAGLWRLQVLGGRTIASWRSRTASAKSRSWLRAASFSTARDRLVVDNYPSVSCFLVREQNQNVDADLPLIAKGLHLDLDQLRATHRIPLRSPATSPSRSSRT
jgi:penicillin-binding protein 2